MNTNDINTQKEKYETLRFENFGYLNGLFINFYTDENPILNTDDECYFLFSNANDLHKLMIGRGKIIYDFFNDGLNKLYYVRLDEVIEDSKTLDNFFYRKNIQLSKYVNEKIVSKTLQVITKETTIDFFETYLFKVECFFIRNDLEKIKLLRSDYYKVVIDELQKQIKDMLEDEEEQQKQE